MLSLEQCRRLIGDDIEISDDDLVIVRRDLYALADVATEALMELKEAETLQISPLNSTTTLNTEQADDEEERRIAQ